MNSLRSGYLSAVALLSGVTLMLTGCASTGERAERDRLTQQVGQYDPPPRGIERPRVGVPPFTVGRVEGVQQAHDMDDLAADQMTTLLDRTGRFRVIERTQLEQLLREQDLEGIVQAGEMARQGQVRGVDYLLLGRVTNFRVRVDETQAGVDAGGVVGMLDRGRRLPRGRTGYERTESNITTEVGVDIRLVDPTTGEIMMTSSSEFNRTDTASAMGVNVMGVGGRAGAQQQIARDDAGRILRLAFDDAVREALPRIDRFLEENHRAGRDEGAERRGDEEAEVAGGVETVE